MNFSETEETLVAVNNNGKRIWSCSDADKDALLAKVREELAEAERNYKRIKNDRLDSKDDGGNGLDDVAGNSKYSEDPARLLELQRAKNRLAELRIVEKQIINETFYPLCSCGEFIPLKKLMFIPTAKSCIACCQNKTSKK